MNGIKAYRVEDCKGDGYATIVFAKSVGEAKTIALATDACSEAQYIDIRVRRLPDADRLYKGGNEIDWYDPKTRLVLVRDFSWSCEETSYLCDNCPAKPYCCWYEEERDDG